MASLIQSSPSRQLVFDCSVLHAPVPDVFCSCSLPDWLVFDSCPDSYNPITDSTSTIFKIINNWLDISISRKTTCCTFFKSLCMEPHRDDEVCSFDLSHEMAALDSSIVVVPLLSVIMGPWKSGLLRSWNHKAKTISISLLFFFFCLLLMLYIVHNEIIVSFFFLLMEY